MPSLAFIVPVHGRTSLAQICLRQLRRTCDALIDHGVEASAYVIGDAENLDALNPGDLGFWTYEQDNRWVSRKFNDGIQAAADPAFNRTPADYVVPCGSDDWVDWRLFVDLPRRDTFVGFCRISFVREDGRELTSRFLRYEGGCGIRIYPRQVMEAVGYRPADEDRTRACDTSILVNLRKTLGDRLRVHHASSDARQIVDWKTAGDEQLNPYESLVIHRSELKGDPFVELHGFFPDESLNEMRRHYIRERQRVAA